MINLIKIIKKYLIYEMELISYDLLLLRAKNII